MATSEDDLQTMAHHLNLIARKYKMNISSTKTKSMAMWGNHIQRVKIVINDNIIEQVADFKYFKSWTAGNPSALLMEQLSSKQQWMN